MEKKSIRERLNLMEMAGHPVFVFGDNVFLPIEAEDFFEPEEMDAVRECVLLRYQKEARYGQK